MDTLKGGLEKLGYVLTSPVVVDAADYEVPQRRARCIIVASQKKVDPFILPPPVTPNGNRKTVRQTIADLPEAPIGENFEDPLHFSRKHSSKALERLRHISHDGGSRNELPASLVLACHKKLEDAGEPKHYCDVYGTMRWDSVSPTLTTGCTDITKGRYAHPCKDRAITLREAALLQTFPLTYKFSGTPGEVAMQIGNAVPVNLVKNLAGAFLPKGEK